MDNSILISDPDFEWAEQMSNDLSSHSFECTIANNGKDCQLQAYKNPVNSLILDIDTRNHTGLEVLRYMRLNYPQCHIILTFHSLERKKELELSDLEINEMGVGVILVKPFTIAQLLQNIEKDYSHTLSPTSKELQDEEEIKAADKDFTAMRITSFLSGNSTIFDCYIRLGQNKYLKILHKGDHFNKERFEYYRKEKGIEHLYYKTEERSHYISFINNLMTKLSTKPNISLKFKVDVLKTAHEQYIDEIYTKGFKPKLISEGRSLVTNIHNTISHSKDLSKLLKEFEDFDPPSHTHIFLVTFFSGIICENLEWASGKSIELCGMASFFHDIGFLHMDPVLKLVPYDELSPSQKLEYHKHPEVGADMLKGLPGISEQILQIIRQHHETIAGDGYPNQLSGVKIYPLAKVVSLADCFTHFIMKEKLPPLAGLRLFVPNKNLIFKHDAEVIKAFIKGFIEDV